MKKEVLFEYQYLFTCGLIGEYRGFSIKIFPDGTMEERFHFFQGKSYLFREIHISWECVREIEHTLNRWNRYIDKLPQFLYNGSMDGCMNGFGFRGKRVNVLNISFISPQELNKLKKGNPKYYEEFWEERILENIVVIIFDEVARALKKDSIFLSLNNIEIK